MEKILRDRRVYELLEKVDRDLALKAQAGGVNIVGPHYIEGTTRESPGEDLSGTSATVSVVRGRNAVSVRLRRRCVSWAARSM